MPNNHYFKAGTETLGEGAVLLCGFAAPDVADLLDVEAKIFHSLIGSLRTARNRAGKAFFAYCHVPHIS